MVAGCVAAGGHTIVYAGGDPTQPCGDVIVADTDVSNDVPDPNDCRPSNNLPGSTWHEEYLKSADGTILHADVFRPKTVAPPTRTPVILVFSPYANNAGTGETFGTVPPGILFSPTGTAQFSATARTIMSIAPAAFKRGYTIVFVSMRGFGASEGCSDFGGPNDQSDVKAAVEWAADAPWSTGHVGMWGISAEGWTQVMALATHPHGLDAVVIGAPPIDRYAQSYMNGIAYHPGSFGNAGRYGKIAMVPPSLTSDPAQQQHAAQSDLASSCNLSNMAFSNINDPTSAFWMKRNLLPLAARSTVPVFLSQGFMDDNVKPGVFGALWATLTGPHRAWLGQYGHEMPDDRENPYLAPGSIHHDGFLAEEMRWFDTYVRGVPALPIDPAVEIERSDGVWRAESAWPPPDAVARSMRLLPGSYQDVQGNAAEAPDPVNDCRGGSLDGSDPCLRTRNGVGTWTFSSPLASYQHLSGAVRVKVNVSTTVDNANLIALVYAVAPNGSATLITRGAWLMRRSGAQVVSFSLYPQDWGLAAGHRIGVLLSGADDGWFLPVPTGTTVTVRSGSVSFPLLRLQRTSSLEGALSDKAKEQAPFTVGGATIAGATVAFAPPPQR